MSETEKRKIRVFIASPNDLAEERRIFRKAIDQLNIGFGDGANVEFIPLGWEDTLASTGRRSQGVINQDIDSCDVFILAMHRRWGQEAPDAKPYSSYTEEEFHRALERWKKSGSPEIFVFFKRVDAASEADPGPQLSKVIDFRKQLEKAKQTLYRYFDSSQSFLDEVDRHLQAYVQGKLPGADQRNDVVVLPMDALQEFEKAKQEVLEKTEEARQANDAAEEARLQLDATQQQIAEDIAQLAKEGKIELARERLTKLVTDTINIRILYLGYEFFRRTGDIDTAVKILEKWLNLSGANNRTKETAEAFRCFGNLYFTWGEYGLMQEYCLKSLNIEETLGHKEGMAKCYCSLGNLYLAFGEEDKAEAMYQKSLTIDKKLGRKEGIASDYSGLGNLCFARGHFFRAEKMYEKSLVIHDELVCVEGMANDYCNLGNLYLTMEKADQAEEMFRKSLSINEMLCKKEGLANDYGNLGNLYQVKGEFEQAEQMHLKSLAIEEVLGRKVGIAKSYNNLGSLYQAQDKYVLAEEMYKNSLAINEALNRKAGMANNYGNLGLLYQYKGYLLQAKKMYEKSIVLFREIRSPKEKEVSHWLKELQYGLSQ